MRFSSNQVGVGFFGLIYNLAVVAIIAYTAFLLGPIYLENHAVKEALNGLNTMSITSESDSLATSKNKIRNFMAESFRMNSVTHVPLEKIDITRDTNGYDVQVAYDVEVHFIGNVDLKVAFDNQKFVASP